MWGRENGVTSLRRCNTAGAWLVAAGLLVSSGGATAFADAGSDAAKNAGSLSVANGPAASSANGNGHDADKVATSLDVKQKPATTDTTDTVTKPTTQITRNATATVSGRLASADSTATTDSVSETDTAPTHEATVPTDDPAPLTDTAPTGEVAASPTPTLYDAQPSPADTPPTETLPTADPAPTPDASTEVMSAPAMPALPTPTSGTVSSGSDPASSDPTTASAVPTVAEQETTQSTSGSGDTAANADQTVSTPAPPVPVPDVVSVLEEVITPVSEVPADVAPVDAAVNEVQLLTDDESNRRRSAGRGPALSPLQILRLLAQTSGTSFAGNAVATLLDVANQTKSNSAASAFGTTTALSGTSTTSVAARGAPASALPEQLQEFLDTYGQVIVAVSLSALLLAALPGLAGLIIPTVAGMGLGYRQAKAGRTLHASGIAHLAASGPIGVVRSGSLIALRPSRRRLPPPDVEDQAQDVA